jgi:hypothetical protein
MFQEVCKTDRNEPNAGACHSGMVGLAWAFYRAGQFRQES